MILEPVRALKAPILNKPCNKTSHRVEMILEPVRALKVASVMYWSIKCLP